MIIHAQHIRVHTTIRIKIRNEISKVDLVALLLFHVEELCQCLYHSDLEHVGWRQLILYVAQPWPLPSAKDLVDTIRQFSVSGATSSEPEDVVEQRTVPGCRYFPVWRAVT